MSCSGCLKKGRFGYQWQAALALVGPIYDTRLYAPKPMDSYKKALTRTMVGLPSQLGNQIIEDICKKSKKLDGCCCAQAAQALWSLQLPVNIRAHVSGMDFSQATYKSVFEAANQCYLSSCQVQVAAVATPLDETLPAFNNQNQPHAEVAPMGRGGGAPKKNRGGGNQSSGTARGGGRGGRGKNRGGLQQEGQDTPPNLLKAVVTDITLMATRLGTVWHPYPVPGSTRSWPSEGQTSLAQKRIN